MIGLAAQYVAYKAATAVVASTMMSMAGSYLYTQPKDTITAALATAMPIAKTAAVYSGAIACVPAGYAAGKAIAHSNIEVTIEDYLHDKLGWDWDSAMDTANRIKEVVSVGIFAASFIPLAYVAYNDFA